MTQSKNCDRCKARFETAEPSLMVNGQTLCRACHDVLKPICPHCRKLMRACPETAAECPYCGERVVVRLKQILYRTLLLTPKQVDFCVRADKAVAALEKYGLDQRHYAKVVKDYRDETGSDPSEYDIKRKLFYYASKLVSPEDYPKLCEEEAKFVHSCDRQPYFILKKGEEARLQLMEQQLVSHVTLDGPTDECHLCRKLCGDVMTLKLAISAPMAPFQECPMRPLVKDPTTGKEAKHRFPFCKARHKIVAYTQDDQPEEPITVSTPESPAPVPASHDRGSELLRPSATDLNRDEDEQDQRVNPITAGVVARATMKSINGNGKVMYKIDDQWVDELNVPIPILFMSHGDMKGVWVNLGTNEQGKTEYKQVPNSRVQQFIAEVFEEQPELAERRDKAAITDIWQSVEGLVLLALGEATAPVEPEEEASPAENDLDDAPAEA